MGSHLVCSFIGSFVSGFTSGTVYNFFCFCWWHCMLKLLLLAVWLVFSCVVL